MRKLLIAGAWSVTVMAGSSANAADIPVYKAPIAAPVFNWTGCYVGANVGAAWARMEAEWSVNPFAFPVASAVIAGETRKKFDNNKITGGGQLGCDYQFGWGIIGIESDFNWTNFDRTLTGSVNSVNPFTESFASPWISTTRASLVGASGPMIAYATGGLAVARVDFADSISFPATGTTNAFAETNTLFGWTLGVGVEWMLAPGWTVKAEYLYVDLGLTS